MPTFVFVKVEEELTPLMTPEMITRLLAAPPEPIIVGFVVRSVHGPLKVTPAGLPTMFKLEPTALVGCELKTALVMVTALVPSTTNAPVPLRSEERRVGKECRSRWS